MCNPIMVADGASFVKMGAGRAQAGQACRVSNFRHVSLQITFYIESTMKNSNYLD